MQNFQSLEITTKDLSELIKEVFMSTDTVNQFGQTIPNPNLGKHPQDQINTFNVINEISENFDTYNLNKFGMYEDNMIAELEETYTEINHINTYNWSSPLTNDLDLKVFQSDIDEDQYFVIMNVQNGYSDVRTGYYLQIGFLVECRNFDWVYLFHELNSANESFEINGFLFDFDFFMEYGCYRVYNPDLNIDLYDVYIGDYSDCEKWIENKEYE